MMAPVFTSDECDDGDDSTSNDTVNDFWTEGADGGGGGNGGGGEGQWLH